MRVLAYAFVVVSLFTLASLPQMAAAQTRASEDAEYRSVIEEALQEFNRGNWEEASALFERAHRINPSARTLRGMGLTAYEARRYVDSIRHLTEALSETRRPLTQAQRDEVTATLDRARRFVAHLRLNVGPSNARITINGRQVQLDSKGEIATDPGLLEVELSAEGYEPALRRVRLTAGGQEELNVQLSKVRSEAAVTMPTQMAPVTQTPAATAAAPVDQGTSAVSVLKWVVGGVALAGLAAGGVTLAYQKVKAAEYDRDCTSVNVNTQPCRSLMSDVEGPLWHAPIILFSVGGGLFAVATVLFIVDATDDAEPTTTARNGCGLGGPGELGVSCQLTF